MLNVFILLYQGSADCMDIEKPYVAERFSEATLLTEKYVYSRRAKLGCKRSGSFFKALIMGEDDHPKPASKKSRRSHTHKKLDQAAQVDYVVPNLERKVSKPDTNVSIRRVKGSARYIRGQTSNKVVSPLQGILLSSIPTILEQVLKVLLILMNN